MITRQQAIDRMTSDLTKTMADFLEQLPEEISDTCGWFGEDASRLMARAAVNVIEASIDVQQSIKANGIEIGD